MKRESRRRYWEIMNNHIVKYRPQKGALADAMKEMKAFNSIDELFNYIVKKWKGYVSYEDLSISEDLGKDNRTDWKETRYICTKRIGKEIYEIPQCIGICSIEDKSV